MCLPFPSVFRNALSGKLELGMVFFAFHGMLPLGVGHRACDSQVAASSPG